MSLGFGSVSTKDWAALRVGMGGDKLPPADYEVEVLAELRHVEAQPDKWNGRGFLAVKYVTTKNNNSEFQNKVLERLFWYSPNPTDDRDLASNQMTLGDMARLVAAIGFEGHVSDDSGQIDPVATLEAAIAWGAENNVKLLVTVSHTDKGYQNVRRERPTV